MECEIKIQNGLPIGRTYPSLMQSILISTDFDINKTLDLYGVTLLDEFKEAGIENPTLEHIYAFIEQDNINESRNLNKNDKQLLLDISLQQSFTDSIKQAFIKAFNVNGNFGINAEKLKESRLFSDSDIMYLLNNTNPKDIQNLYYKLNRTDEEFDSVSSPVIIEKGNLTKLNPDTFIQNSYDNYVGLTNKNEILERASEVGDDILLDNPTLVDTVLSLISNKQSFVQYETDEYQGNITKKFNNNQLYKLEQTLDIEQDFVPILSQIEYIKDNFGDFTIDDLPMIYAYIKNIENQGKDLGLDLNNLADTMINRNYDDTADFLDSLYNFIYDIQSGDETSARETINDYVDSYNAFFQTTPNETRIIADKMNSQGAFLHLETNRSEEELFNSDSILKVRDNIYQKITDQGDLGYLYDMIFDNPSILPKSVYSAQIKNTNKDLILDDIDQYISKLAHEYMTENSDPVALKRLVSYKLLFGIDNQVSDDVIAGEIDLNVENFLSDFNKQMLKEESLNDIFYFSSRGLEAKQIIGDYTLRQLQNNLSNNLFNDLVQYAKLSGNESLSSFTVLNNEYPTIENNLRDYYANNMNQLSNYNNDYYKDNGYIVTNSNNDFIKVQNELYEQVAPNVFAKIERNNRYLNSNLKKPTYDNSVEPNTTVNTKDGKVSIKRVDNITDDRIEFC